MKPNNILAFFLIIALTFLAYANSLKNSFVLDDPWLITENDFIKSPANLPHIFDKSYLTSPKELDYKGIRPIGSGQVSYRPVATLTYFLDYSLWKLNPAGYHLTNLLLHIASALLLYCLLLLIIGNSAICLLAALLFALHPVNVEVVNGISFRGDLLAFFFFLASFIFFIRSRKAASGKPFYYALSLLSFALALFSKEVAITLPVILIAYEMYFVFQRPLRDFLSGLKSYYAGYIAVCLFYLYVWGHVFANVYSQAVFKQEHLLAKALKATVIFSEYLKWMVIPLGLHLSVPGEPDALAHFAPRVAFSILVILALIFITVKTRRNMKAASFFIFYFFITLLPVSGIIALPNITACRYLYLSLAGFCALVSILLFKLSSREVFRVAPVAVVILAFFIMTTAVNNLVWRNNISFWSDIVESHPRSAKAHAGLAVQFWKKGLPDDAMKEYAVASRINPRSAAYHNGLGICYVDKGVYGEAVKEYKMALALDPASPGIYANLGFAYKDQMLLKEAKDAFNESLKLDPGYLPARKGLAEIQGK